MSILIKGAVIPKGEFPILYAVYPDGHVTDAAGYEIKNGQAIEIPKHGDLVDRDAVIDKMCLDYTAAERNGKLMYASVEVKQGFCDLLTDAPTVIEAEE